MAFHRVSRAWLSLGGSVSQYGREVGGRLIRCHLCWGGQAQMGHGCITGSSVRRS